MTPSRHDASKALRRYTDAGHYSTPSAVIDPDLIRRASECMDKVLAGQYETGVAPHRVDFQPGDDSRMLRRAEQPHWSDRTILDLISSPVLGEWPQQGLRDLAAASPYTSVPNAHGPSPASTTRVTSSTWGT